MDLGHDGGGEMPMPISSSYASLHESAKLKMLTSGNGTGTAGADDMNASTAGVGAGVGVGVGVQQQQQQQLLRPLASLDNSSSNTPSKALVPSPGLGVVGGQPVGLGGVGGGVGVGGVQVVGVSPAPPPPVVAGGGSAVVVAAAPAVAAGGGAGGAAAAAVGGGQKKAVRYRECHKNHAASMGGHAIDGCGEFMPSGEEGTLESLKCAACDCHRNFHRREVEGEQPACDCHLPPGLRAKDRKRSSSVGPVGVGGGAGGAGGGGGVPVGGGVGGLSTPSPLPLPNTLGMMPSRTPAPILMALNTGPADSDDQEGGLGSASPAAMKKRFRTKFSTEQKEKMCTFADKLGWKIQKHDEAAVQQFCADVGVKRHVLKVWMHNNKHTLGKKL